MITLYIIRFVSYQVLENIFTDLKLAHPNKKVIYLNYFYFILNIVEIC